MATSNYSFNLPTVGGSEDAWGTSLNANWTALDTLLGGTNATEFAILDGATVTTAELNILDGVTATAAELNILDGVTASTAELNILDGVTATTAELNILDGVTATAAELNVVDGITGIASEAEAQSGTASDKLMTPQRTAQAIAALAPEGVGEGQTWQAVTRASGTTYQNTTGKPIMVAGECAWQSSSGFQVSTDGSTWLTLLDSSENDFTNPFSIIIPDNLYYRINGTIIRINELR